MLEIFNIVEEWKHCDFEILCIVTNIDEIALIILGKPQHFNYFKRRQKKVR